MATSRRIQDIVYNHPTGDVEGYFKYLDDMISVNSGNHDYRILSHDSYQISVPVPENQATKFRITDPSMDIVDISQGYINLKCKIDLEYKAVKPGGAEASTDRTATYADNFTYFFIGFKSAAHIIDQYNVFSNGRLTACKQTKSKYEQTVVYNSKAKEEKRARPGMYSAHKDVLKMRDCVCGQYVQVKSTTKTVTLNLDLIIQIDDLLPFSAMTYYPRFAVRDLEIEIICNLQKCMVFCQVPYEEVIKNRCAFGYDNGKTDHTVLGDEMLNNVNHVLNEAVATQVQALSVIPLIQAMEHPIEMPMHKLLMDTRFHQCGDYARCLLGLVENATPASGGAVGTTGLPQNVKLSGKNDANLAYGMVSDYYCTFKPTSLTINEAKSYVFGFNLNQEAKQKVNIMLEKMGQLKIPAQWVDHTSFPQQAGTYQLKMNTMMNLYECGQLIITFPNSVDQLTVSRNPMLDAVKCQIDDRIVPDKMMSTYDKAHTEMTLTALGFDSLFAAPPELIQSLSYKEEWKASHFRIKHEDDSNYMFVADLERSGAGIFHDGFSKSNCAINFDGTYHHATDNPHYYEYNPTLGTYAETAKSFALHKVSPNIFSVSDAYWAFGPNGGEFIKDAQTLPLINEIETAKEAVLQEEMAAAEAMGD